MTAFNVVRFRVKPGREEQFVNAHRDAEANFPGMRRVALVKTGERAYCVIGGGGLGVTDPVSGDVVVEMRRPVG